MLVWHNLLPLLRRYASSYFRTMSFLFGDSSESGEGEMAHVFGDGGSEDVRQDSKTSDGEGDSFFTSTSAFGGTPTRKDNRPTSSQGRWDSGSNGGAVVGLAHPVPVTGQPQEDPFLTPSHLPPPEKKRSYSPSPVKTLPQQQQRGLASKAAMYREATPGDGTRSRENLASGRSTSLAATSSSAVLRELVAMQQKQIGALLPEMEEAERRDRELEGALELVGRDTQAYRQQLGALREQYSNRLSQVMGFIQRP